MLQKHQSIPQFQSCIPGCVGQRFIDFEDIKDAKVNGKVSLVMCFDGEEDKIHVMGEIHMWADKIKHETQFEDIVLCDTKVKGRDRDLRLEVRDPC